MNLTIKYELKKSKKFQFLKIYLQKSFELK